MIRLAHKLTPLVDLMRNLVLESPVVLADCQAPAGTTTTHMKRA